MLVGDEEQGKNFALQLGVFGWKVRSTVVTDRPRPLRQQDAHPQRLETHQPWVVNGRRLRDLARQLGTLSIDAVRTSESWNSQSGGLKALRKCEKRVSQPDAKRFARPHHEVIRASQGSVSTDRNNPSPREYGGDLGSMSATSSAAARRAGHPRCRRG